jgi:hypothetical protein
MPFNVEKVLDREKLLSQNKVIGKIVLDKLWDCNEGLPVDALNVDKSLPLTGAMNPVAMALEKGYPFGTNAEANRAVLAKAVGVSYDMMFDPRKYSAVGNANPGIFPVQFDPVINPPEEIIERVHFFRIHPEYRVGDRKEQVLVAKPKKGPGISAVIPKGKIDVYPFVAHAAGLVDSIPLKPIYVTTYSLSVDTGTGSEVPWNPPSDSESSVTLSSQSTPYTVKSPANSNESDTINDPVQGASLDCYFLAALSATTWSLFSSPFPKQFGQSTLPTAITFFWVDDATKKCYYQNYPLNQRAGGDYDGKVKFAKLTPDKNESWCSLYEQAYAKMKGIATDQYGNFRINLFGMNSPMSVLKYLNIRSTWTSDTSTTDPNKSSLFDIATAKSRFVHPDPTNPEAVDTSQWNSFDQLLKNLTTKGWNSVAGAKSAKLKNPTTAWTKSGQGSDPIYSDYLVVARHAYSVLGLLKEGGKNYIVLRNPWGPLPNLGTPTNQEIKDNLATGPYQPPSMTNYALSIKLYKDITDNENRTTRVYGGENGCFGLEYTIFEKYFGGFGWVAPITCTISTGPIP